MNFTIDHEKRDTIEFLILRNLITGESLECIPELGATISTLSLQLKGKATNILEGDSPETLRANPFYRGRILFPFNDMIPGGVYTFNGSTYNLPVNQPKENKALHGFVYDKPFKTIWEESTRNFCKIIVSKTITSDEHPGYPFDCTLTLSYILRVREFQMNMTVKNTGNRALPFSFGWHPYFTFGISIDDNTLQMQCDSYIEVDANLLPTRRLLPCNDSRYDFAQGKLIGAEPIDMGFTAPRDGKIFLGGDKGYIIVNQNGDFFNFVQLFIPPDRRSIAIEPVTAATNSFNFSELGLRVLEPNEEATGFVVVKTADTL